MILKDKIDRLRFADFRVCYARIGEWGYPRTPSGDYTWQPYEMRPERIHSSDVSDTPGGYDGTFLRAYVDLGRVARSEDQAGQSSTLDRSNYRRLLEDYPESFTVLSYSNVDCLGAYVGNLTEEVIDVLTGLVTDYPAYDDSDMSELESEEITESWDQYVRYDVAREIPEKYRDQWDDLDDLDVPATDDQPMQEKKAEVFWAAVQAADYYPEHSGLDVVWRYDQFMPQLIDGIETASAIGYDTTDYTHNPNQTVLPF